MKTLEEFLNEERKDQFWKIQVDNYDKLEKLISSFFKEMTYDQVLEMLESMIKAVNKNKKQELENQKRTALDKHIIVKK